MLRYGNITYTDELVWGRTFERRRQQGEYPFQKVPVMYVGKTSSAVTIAQSGSIARMVAKLAGCYPSNPVDCAFNDAVFEMGQELCTINPLINCYVGEHYRQVHQWYFSSLPSHLSNLERQLMLAQQKGPEKSNYKFYGGDVPSHADFNVFHHLDNAQHVEPECVDDFPRLLAWKLEMETLPTLKEYLEERPTLVGIGTDPGLVDKTGRLLKQKDYEGRAILRDGVFYFDAEDIDPTPCE
eukprot:Awhi_evm1s5552